MPFGASKKVRAKRAKQEAENNKGFKVLPDPKGIPFGHAARNAANDFLMKQRAKMKAKKAAAKKKKGKK